MRNTEKISLLGYGLLFIPFLALAWSGSYEINNQSSAVINVKPYAVDHGDFYVGADLPTKPDAKFTQLDPATANIYPVSPYTKAYVKTTTSSDIWGTYSKGNFYFDIVGQGAGFKTCFFYYDYDTTNKANHFLFKPDQTTCTGNLFNDIVVSYPRGGTQPDIRIVIGKYQVK